MKWNAAIVVRLPCSIKQELSWRFAQLTSPRATNPFLLFFQSTKSSWLAGNAAQVCFSPTSPLLPPQHFHSQRCDSNIIGSVTEPRVQAPKSAFPPHPWILYLSPFNLLWSWIGSRSCQPLCITPMTWQHATPHVKVLKDSAQCKISIPEFTQQARQTATRFLLYAWPGTGGVATACHSRVSIHCCLAAKVLLLLEILETGFSYQKSEKLSRMTGGQCAGKMQCS